MDLQSVRKALSWSVAENAGLAAVSVLVLVVVARQLPAADFGTFAVVLAVVEFGSLLVTAFFHDALIQRQQPTWREYSSAFWCTMAAALAFVLLCLAGGGLIEGITRDDRSRTLLAIVAMAVPAQALASIEVIRLRKEMRMRPLALASLASRSVGAALCMLALWLGAGIWALALQHVGTAVINGAIVLRTTRPRYAWELSAAALGPLLRFALTAFTAQLMGFSVRRVFTLLCALYMSAQLIGYLSMGLRITDTIWALVAVAVGQVALPMWAGLRAWPERITKVFCDAGAVLVVAVALAFGLLAALAPDLMRIVFGERWLPAAPFVAITAACVPLQAIRLLLQSLITATGRPGLNVRAGIAELITLAVSIPLLQSSGLMGAAYAWLLREVVVCMWLSLQVGKLGTLTPSAPWKAAAPGLVAMLVMLAACEVVRRLVVNPQWPAAATLLAVMLVGMVVFSAAALLLDRHLIERFRRVLLGRGAAASSPKPVTDPGE